MKDEFEQALEEIFTIMDPRGPLQPFKILGINVLEEGPITERMRRGERVTNVEVKEAIAAQHPWCKIARKSDENLVTLTAGLYDVISHGSSEID